MFFHLLWLRLTEDQVYFIYIADRRSLGGWPWVGFWCCWVTSTRWQVTSCPASLQASRHVSAAARYAALYNWMCRVSFSLQLVRHWHWTAGIKETTPSPVGVWWRMKKLCRASHTFSFRGWHWFFYTVVRHRWQEFGICSKWGRTRAEVWCLLIALLGHIAALASCSLLLQISWRSMVCLCVCLLVTAVSPAKMAEPSKCC